ncbi:MAG: hypothetical protein JWQ38_548 [Flavipsychrobacter sp.]|nr:hypothetical protein [Flavipsychrobacter sp.]
MNLFNLKSNEEPQTYIVKGKQLLCHHCSNDMFVLKYHTIHEAGSLINQPASCFICTECTHMHWFQATE